jgi:opacity protein-like surface antigen
MKPLSRLALLALLAAPLARPAAGQVNQDRAHQWYVGAHAGGLLYKTNTQGYFMDPMFGVNFLITAKRSALYLGGEEAFFLTDSHANVVDPTSGATYDVTFSKVRRLFAGLVAYPVPGHIEPFIGAGVAIITVVDAVPSSAGGQTATDAAANKAAGWLMGGIQINVSRLSVFGQYMIQTAANNFLLSEEAHSVQGGIRYSLGSAKEDVQTRH